jgi:hypothetical protein
MDGNRVNQALSVSLANSDGGPITGHKFDEITSAE